MMPPIMKRDITFVWAEKMVEQKLFIVRSLKSVIK